MAKEVTRAEFQRIEAKALPEDTLTEHVLRTAHDFHWRAVHFRAARTIQGWRTPLQGPTAKGFPDMVLVRDGRILFRELKAEKGKLTPEQAEWIDALLLAGQDAGVWRPSGWLDGTIVKALL